MESPKLRLMAKAFLKDGIAVVRFDFRGCGISGGDIKDTTVSGRVTDLQAVLDHVREELGIRGSMGLIGSSMGGYVALLCFAKRTDLSTVCVWATPFNLEGLSGMRNHPDLAALGPAFYEDVKRHDLRKVVDALHHVLVLHGENDTVIPQDHGIQLFEHVSEPKAIHIFPEGDHRFSNPVHRDQAIGLSLRWFKTHAVL
jgi:dipeptidyl aminopeptidase/acylaminoacyl peptidase